MSLGLCVLVRDRQDSICVRFARAGLFCAGSPLLCRIAGPAAFCRVRRILFFPFFRVFRSIMSVVRRGRGTRRACRTLQFDQGSDRCAWCLSMGANAPAVCTYKACGTQAKFIGTACVRRACFGHMVASVWDGSHVRRQNNTDIARHRFRRSLFCRRTTTPFHTDATMWPKHAARTSAADTNLSCCPRGFHVHAWSKPRMCLHHAHFVP